MANSFIIVLHAVWHQTKQAKLRENHFYKVYHDEDHILNICPVLKLHSLIVQDQSISHYLINVCPVMFYYVLHIERIVKKKYSKTWGNSSEIQRLH